MLQVAETVEFSEELYKKNIEENVFVDDEQEGIGEDDATDNEG